MRGFGFLCLILLIGTAASVQHDYFSLSSNPGGNAMKLVPKSRKLEDNMDPHSHMNLEDYRPVDPVPNSKASIRPGPVQHGTPLMPYIPKPSPSPGGPQHGG